jgi:hypothetical protein
MYPAVIKFNDPFSPIASILGVIVMWLLSYALIQGYFENGRSLVALICIILLHFIIIPVGLFFLAMVFNPPVSTLSPEGVKVKIFPRTSFYKWSDIEDDLKVSSMPGWPKFTNIHFITFGQFFNETYLVPLHFFANRSRVLETVKSYREAALKDKSINQP